MQLHRRVVLGPAGPLLIRTRVHENDAPFRLSCAAAAVAPRTRLNLTLLREADRLQDISASFVNAAVYGNNKVALPGQTLTHGHRPIAA